MASPAPRRHRRVLIVAGIGILFVCVCALIGLGALILISPMAGSPMTTGATPPATDGGGTLPSAGNAGGPLPTGAPAGSEPTVFAFEVTPVPNTPRAATAPPTNVPALTAAPPQPTTIAQVATGDLHFDYPLTLMVDKDDIVKVEIIPDQSVALAAPLNSSGVNARVLIESGANESEHKQVFYSIPVYPVMAAELATARAQDLIIVAGAEAKQTLAEHDATFWTWSLVAKRGGEYRVTLRIFGYNQLDDEDPVRRVVDDTRIIKVQDRSIGDRLMQGLTDNWLVLFGAGGPIALVVLLLTFFYSRRDAARRT